jgi:hypothetical protein
LLQARESLDCSHPRNYTSENVDLLESIIIESRKLEVANHEAVRIIAAQLDRAKRIAIVQQAILSAVSRSNLSDLDISIATAQQLVGDDRDWLLQANKDRFILTIRFCIFGLFPFRKRAHEIFQAPA